MGEMADFVNESFDYWDSEMAEEDVHYYMAQPKIRGQGPCPKCKGPTHKCHGPHGDFYGCDKFPQCKGSRSL